MKCLKCKTELSSINLADNVGFPFQIQKCSKCGSFWLPMNTIYKITHADAQKLDQAEPTNESAQGLRCGNCNAELHNVNDLFLPDYLKLYRCPSCFGYFLLPGQLAAYKGFQEKRPNIKYQPVIDQKSKGTALFMLATFILLTFVFWTLKMSGRYSIGADSIKEMLSIHNLFYEQIEPILISLVALVAGVVAYILGRKSWVKNIGWGFMGVAFVILFIWFLSQ